MIRASRIRLGNITEHPYGAPILILIISILSYGLLIPWLHFYHDEYPIIWFHSIMGNINIFFEGNRPLLAWLYKPLLILFNSNAWIWHCFGVLSRWIHAYVFYLLIKQIWPKQGSLPIMASLMILVFPGFQTQFASMIYGISFLLFSVFLLSIYFSVLAVKNEEKRILYISLALLFSAINLLTSEYFYILELVRYLILFFVLKHKLREGNHYSVFKETFPYLSLFIIISIFRIFIQAQETTYPIVLVDRIASDPMHQIPLFFKEQWIDILNVTIKSWITALRPAHLSGNLSARIEILFLLIAISSSILVALTLWGWLQKKMSRENISEIILVGIAALYSAGWPLWIAGLPIGEFYSYSRWTIPFMMGASLLTGGFLLLPRKNHVLSIILFSLLIGIGVRNQLMVANSFRHDWQEQQQFFWQLKWRIPSLQENTVFFSDMLPFKYENSDQLSAGINLIFSPSDHANKISYFLFYIPERINTSILPDIKEGIPIRGKRYYQSFQGNTSQAIILDFQHPSCLKVLDPAIDSYNPSISPIIKDSLFLSDEDLILERPGATDNQNILGKEPAHEWCYFYQKAELARQFNKWDHLDSLYREVRNLGYQPRDNREWLPFIEGLIHSGNYNEAFIVCDSIINQSMDYKDMICLVWKNASDKAVPSELNEKLKSEFSCTL